MFSAISSEAFPLGYLSLILTILTVIYLVTGTNSVQLFLCAGRKNSPLPVPVSRLSISDVTIIIILIIIKYIAKLFKIVPALQEDEQGADFLLPELSIIANLAIDEDDEHRYDAAAAAGNPTTPNQSPRKPDRLLFIPALVNPLQSLLLANRNCPVFPFGCVNTKNRFEFLDTEVCRNPRANLDLSRTIVVASMGGLNMKGRRVKRGVEFDVEMTVITHLGSGRRSDEQAVFKQISTILAFLPASRSPRATATSTTTVEDRIFEWSSEATSLISLRPSAPNLWAAVCKDYNPIHMSGLLAKLFGFPNKIAHGMHMLSIAVEQLQSNTGASSELNKKKETVLRGESPFALEVSFKRPMVLPLRMAVHYGSEKESLALKVMKKDKEHLLAYTESISG